MSKPLAGHKIGFVGLGNMGRANARHLHEAGADVVVWNRSAAPAEAAVALGMRRASSLPDLARDYRDAGIAWIAIGDENYGEGSSREHAAMEPRIRNGKVVLVRSFARIHEANLKKQGILPLTFANPADYERIRWDDRIDVVGLAELAPGRPVTVVINHSDGTSEEIQANHSFSDEQLAWFRAGSALNVLRSREAE